MTVRNQEALQSLYTTTRLEFTTLLDPGRKCKQAVKSAVKQVIEL